MDSKFALTSKSIQGLVLVALAHFGPLMGIEMKGEAEAFLADVCALAGLVWALFGRYTAEKPIYFVRKPTGMLAPGIACLAVVGALILQGCGTVRAVRTDPKDYGAIAEASCSDLTNGVTISRAALPWVRIYFPNKEKQIDEDIEPALEEAALGVEAYCEAAGLVSSAQGWSALVTERDRLLALSARVAALIAAIRR